MKIIFIFILNLCFLYANDFIKEENYNKEFCDKYNTDFVYEKIKENYCNPYNIDNVYDASLWLLLNSVFNKSTNTTLKKDFDFFEKVKKNIKTKKANISKN